MADSKDELEAQMTVIEDKEEEKLPVQPCEPATNTLARKRKEQRQETKPRKLPKLRLKMNWQEQYFKSKSHPIFVQAV